MKASGKKEKKIEKSWIPIIRIQGDGEVVFSELHPESYKVIEKIWKSLVKRGVIV